MAKKELMEVGPLEAGRARALDGAAADTPNDPGGTRPYAALQGVGRAMEILETIAVRPMRASEIVEELGLKWTTAHRSLTYLTDSRYLRRDAVSGVYSIGPRLFYLGQAYLTWHPLIDAGATALRALAHETHASAQLNEREGFEATVLVAVDEAIEVIPKTSTEHRFGLSTGSKGQVLLAYSEPGIFDAMTRSPLPSLTPHSITDPAELARVLAQIRRDGYRVTRRDVQNGTGSVAAPIFDADGMLVGAACLILKIEDFGPDREPELITAITRMTLHVSSRLGWRPGSEPVAVAQWREREESA